MEIVKVRDWVKLKDIQFVVLSYAPDGRMHSVIRIKDRKVFEAGEIYPLWLNKDLYLELVEFESDLVHLKVATKHFDGPEVNISRLEINDF